MVNVNIHGGHNTIGMIIDKNDGNIYYADSQKSHELKLQVLHDELFLLSQSLDKIASNQIVEYNKMINQCISNLRKENTEEEQKNNLGKIKNTLEDVKRIVDTLTDIPSGIHKIIETCLSIIS